MATVDKNFRIKHGLVVEGSTATVNGNTVLTENAGDQYILDLIGGETLVKSVESTQLEVDGNGKLSVKSNVFDAYGAASSAQSAAEGYADSAISTHNSDTLNVHGIANTADLATKNYADTAAGNAQSSAESYADTAAGNAQSAAQSYADGLATNYDAAGAASAAEAAANTYTDNQINALTTSDIEEGSNLYFTDERAQDAIGNHLGNGLSYNDSTGAISVDTSVIANKSYVDTAINNLIDGAPGLLDTLNEIAAAINDDANYFTTVANAIAAKQNTLTAGSNIDITNDVISVTGLDTDDVSEGSNLYFTDTRARDAVDGTDRSFTSVAINSVAKEIAATTGNIVTAAATTAYSWAKTSYRSGKFLVKIKNGSNTEVSEVLVTLDTSDNVYLTEYGMSSTSGTSLGTITADVSGSDVRIRVTPANNNSEVMVVGTVLI